ncbi:hypothetical protein XELAEV_18021636mg [Xenopus laevis]|uniref:Uncharacterized protein n=1 Tax=Xenopus laevis TaxID=8355 RepID=A0A974HS13_XENLA|nr:hypothetical protein XELAEV_18021636mg [Xenopus laevis]
MSDATCIQNSVSHAVRWRTILQSYGAAEYVVALQIHDIHEDNNNSDVGFRIKSVFSSDIFFLQLLCSLQHNTNKRFIPGFHRISYTPQKKITSPLFSSVCSS